MRIALLAPLVTPLREPQTGGVATFLTDLAAGLGEAGHEVHVFAAAGSQVDGLAIVDTGVDASTLAATLFRPASAQPASAGGRRPSSPAGGRGPRAAAGVRRTAPANAAFAAAYERIARGSYDLVHNHAFDAPAIELAGALPVPVVHTLHLPPDALVAAALRAAATSARRPWVAAISPSHRRAWERHAHIDALLRPGVPTARIPWSERSGGSLLFAGRLSPEKGALEAVEIARASGRDLLVAGGPYDPGYARAVERAAASSGCATLVGALTRSQLWQRMAEAAALLFPIAWEEPFGLVPAEAQAAGCPVIGFRGGALDDVVLDGTTGAVLDPGDIEGAARALSALERYDRTACRRHAEQSLGIDAALEAHESLYADVLRGRRSG